MSASFEGVRALCKQAVADGVVPGLALLVASGGRTVHLEALGARQVVPRRLPVEPSTVFDVASLTKAVVTSVLTMQLIDAGKLSLATRLVERLPELVGPGKDQLTVRDLLCHASGLPAWRPLHEIAARSEGAARRWTMAVLAAREPLEYEPRSRSVYSDLGFILLGWLVERAGGLRLDALAARRIFGPLGLTSTTFVNLASNEARARLLANTTVAATQLCPVRKRVLTGEVDDLNAHAMGGIAGHAGLFTTVTDLGILASALCATWKSPTGSMLASGDVLREFWRPSGIPGSTWRLGWDGPAATGSQAGERLPRSAVGHLGFTGCSLWIDPDRERWIALLTNRVHPKVPSDDRFRHFRPALHDAVIDALEGR